MAKEQQAQDQDQGAEHEGNESEHDELVSGLETHDAGPDTGSKTEPGKPEEKAGTEHGAHAEGATPKNEHEGTAAQAEQPRNAVDAISKKVAKARTKMYDKGEARRLKTQKARIEARSGGKDWTATELADVIKGGGAQELLRQIGARKPAEAIALLKSTAKYDPWVAALGLGKLHNMAATAMDNLVMDSIITGADLKVMFKVRYAVDIADGSAAWTDDNIRVTWRQMSQLPAQDVNGNKNTAISILTANGGNGGGTYNSGTKKIDLGQNGGDEENLTETVRHEIGHGVHEQLKGEVNQWLKNDIGFVDVSFKDFVDELGGFPATYSYNGSQHAFTEQYKNDMVTLVDQSTGASSWSPVGPVGQGQDPQYAAMWAAMPAAVRNGVTQSKANWFSNFENFQKKNGSFYFLNHWYHTPMKFSQKAANVIHATNDKYAAMSDKEFFATSYAEYFRDPTGIKDHKNWGGNLPGSVKSFFKECIVQRNPYDKFQKGNRVKKT